MRNQVIIISMILFCLMLSKPIKLNLNNSYDHPVPYRGPKTTTITSNKKTLTLVTKAQTKIDLVKQKRAERDSLMNEIMIKKKMIDSLRALVNKNN